MCECVRENDGDELLTEGVSNGEGEGEGEGGEEEDEEEEGGHGVFEDGNCVLCVLMTMLEVSSSWSCLDMAA